ncbi:response regulator transcription factor [Skermania sp. ID1734]|uniref:response regulator transcription factor n=1 Tax=Skermania sp. ID1734 TaxID=2597516 RepID=UPI00117C30DA|nr:response regulator transcription factor [Skermania sp. ID1734]TSE00452.1 response regulator transcription factor [Skermania sp. ID1734]
MSDSTDGSGPVSVALVDDHEVVHDGLISWFRDVDPPIAVSATFTRPADFLEKYPAAAGSEIDVVILDLTFAERATAPAEHVATIASAGYRVVVYSSSTDPHVILDCLDAGALTYLAKVEGREHMVAAVRAALTDTPYVSPSMERAMVANPRSSRPKLSDREIEVLREWFRTESKGATGEALHISVGTVNTHLARIRMKYARVGRQASTKAALVARAIQDGIVHIEDL